MFKDLREYLNSLEGKGYLKRIKVEVDPHLEIAEIMRRMMYRKGPALLFESVKGYQGWRIAGNIFGRMEFLKIALGAERLEELGERFLALMPLKPPMKLGEKILALREMLSAGKFLPKVVKKGPVKEVISQTPSLDEIPALKVWPKDRGRYLTYPLVITRDPKTNIMNLGVYRVQLIGPKKALIHWQVHKRGAEAYGSTIGRGRLEVAIAIGGDPAILFTGVSPVPGNMDKYLFAGILRGKGVELIKGESTDLLIPAHAEIVLEGYVDEEKGMEGPFGDHYGYYTPPARYPVFHLESISMRGDPIYHATVTGKPPLEDSCLGKATERIFLPILRFFIPELVDVNLPEYGLFQGLGIVSIRKRYPGQAKKVMMALWGLGQMSLTKIFIVVDEDVNVHDFDQVIYAIASTVNPARDVVIVPNTHSDILDHASPVAGYGSKLGIDATRKLREEYGKDWPEEVSPDPETVEKVNRRWKSYGLE